MVVQLKKQRILSAYKYREGKDPRRIAVKDLTHDSPPVEGLGASVPCTHVSWASLPLVATPFLY